MLYVFLGRISVTPMSVKRPTRCWTSNEMKENFEKWNASFFINMYDLKENNKKA